MKKRTKIILTAAAVLAAAAAGGFGYLYSHGLSGLRENTPANAGQIRIACVGDSITYGHGVQNWKENNYPAVLQGLLGTQYHVANFGVSGSCVNPAGDQPYVNTAAYEESLAYEADILVFMLGSNDSKPKNWTDTDTFLAQYTQLLESYLAGSKKPKVYIGLCAKAFFPEGVSQGCTSFDIRPAVVQQIVQTLQGLTLADGTQVTVLDVYSLTEANPQWFAADNVHPDAAGAAAIARLVAQTIEN